jgi:hypothetical protein
MRCVLNPRSHKIGESSSCWASRIRPRNLAVYEQAPQQLPPRRVKIAWLTSDDLAKCDAHPRATEFRRYLDWKRHLIKARHERAVHHGNW